MSNLAWAKVAVFIGFLWGCAAMYAPYLPRLLFEGYPGPEWPAMGYFARLGGNSISGQTAPPPKTPLDRDLQTEFDLKDGRAILASKDGRLVLEHYAPGTTRETRFNSYSMAKSLIGALVLKAIAEKRIAGFETPIGELLPSIPDDPATRSIRSMPLCRFLDMQSGISFQPDAAKTAAGFAPKDFEATKYNLFGPMARLHMGGLESVLDKLVSSGELPSNTGCGQGTYSYQNANTAILGAVIERIYAQPLETVLSEKIWKPAGAANADWRRYDANLPVTPYCCIYARPVDWLRVAEFLLNNGTKDQPYLPQDLWRQFMGLDLSAEQLKDGHYVHHLYHDILDRPGEALSGPFAYFLGRGGQVTYIMPSQKLAVVRFGGQIQKLHTTLYGAARSISEIAEK